MCRLHARLVLKGAYSRHGLLRGCLLYTSPALRGRLQRRRAQPRAAHGQARDAHDRRGPVRAGLARERLRVCLLYTSRASKAGFLFRSTDAIKADNPDLPAFEEFGDLLAAIKQAVA